MGALLPMSLRTKSANGIEKCRHPDVARDRLRHPDPLFNPIVLLYSLNLARVVELQRAGRHEELVAHLAEICELLRGAGAEVGALTANTPHLYLDRIRARTGLELVGIVKATCAAVTRLGLERPLLLGTRATMEGSMYRDALAADGIRLLAPDDGEMEFIDHAIYNELALGLVPNDIRTRVLELCRGALERRGADGVILACTELPLVVSGDDLPAPVVDTARVHVEAILDRAQDRRSRRGDVEQGRG